MSELETRDDGLYVDGRKVLKGWESLTGWYWFALEDTGARYRGKPIWFGFVQGFEEEWGEFAEGELDQSSLVWQIKENDLRYAGRRKVTA